MNWIKLKLTNLLEMTVSQKNSMKIFWDHVRVPLLLSFKMAFLEKEYFSQTSCNKTYWKKELQQKVYKKLETYIF